MVVGCATIGPRDTLIRDVFATFHPLGRVKTRFFVRQGVKREVRSPRQSARGDFEFRPAPRDSITNRLLSSSVPSARLQNPFPRRIDPTYRSRRSEFFLRPASSPHHRRDLHCSIFVVNHILQFLRASIERLRPFATFCSHDMLHFRVSRMWQGAVSLSINKIFRGFSFRGLTSTCDFFLENENYIV